MLKRHRQLPGGKFSRHAAGHRLWQGDIVSQHTAIAHEIGVEIGDHEIVGHSVIDRLDALDFRPTGNRVQPVACFKLLGHPPADARDPKQVSRGGDDFFLFGAHGKQILMTRGNIENWFERQLARQRIL